MRHLTVQEMVGERALFLIFAFYANRFLDQVPHEPIRGPFFHGRGESVTGPFVFEKVEAVGMVLVSRAHLIGELA
jgi:hypothetical protein